MSVYGAARGPWSATPPGTQACAPALGSAPPAIGGASAADLPVKASFSGAGGEFLRLCLRAGVFSVVTLGLYRFWFLTDMRRLLWRHTRVGEDGLEYRGTGRELLLGFLFALAILAPLYLGYFLLGIEAERYRAFASTPFFLILMLFGVYASYRARRYRLTRTVFRGARFWMTGSGMAYLLRYLVWGLVTLLTLGLAYPWMAASLERYKMRNTYYGDLQGGFAASGWSFFKRGVVLWLLTVPPLVTLLVWLGSLAGAGPGNQHGANAEGVTRDMIYGLATLLLPVDALFYCLMRGIEWRWWVEGLRFGAARVQSTLGAWFLFKQYAKLALAMGLVFVAAAILFGIVASIGGQALGQLPPARIGTLSALLHLAPVWYAIGAATLLAYLTLFVVVSAVYRRFLLFGVWRKVVDSLTLHDGQVFDNVTVKGTPSGVIGEALADALDFGF